MRDAVEAVSAVTPLVELDAGLEVVLVTSPALRNEVSELAQELLAAGFEASVVIHDEDDAAVSEICSIGADGLIAVCHRGDLDQEALRSRCEERGVAHHEWVDCTTTDHARTLYGTIASRIDAIADERAQPWGDVPDVDEVSNVVLFPLPPKEPPAIAADPVPTPRPTRRTDVQDRSWLRAGLASAALTAMSAAVFWAIGGPRGDAPTMPAPQAELVPAVAESEPVPKAESTLGVPVPVEAALPPAHEPGHEPVRSVPEPVPEPAPEPPSREQSEPVSDDVASVRAALDAGTIFEAGDLLVTEARAGERTWFEAMTWCRSRAFGGVRGWKTPRRADLVALAKARILPDAVLWSRNRSDDTGQAAFVLHGRSGRLDRRDKHDTTKLAVCVLPRGDVED